MRKRTVSFEEIDDRGKLREEPAEESKPGDRTAEGESEEMDVVDEIGEEVGITYADDEELRLTEKEAERDAHRWELNPASAEDYAQRAHPHGEGPAEAVRHMKHRPTVPLKTS